MTDKTQILVVEDDLIVAQSIKSHLNTLGYHVPALKANGKAAVEKAKEVQPDLVLMDIKLPGKMDGIQAAEEIRKFNKSIPIIALTAYALAGDKAKLMNKNFDDYISKPISPADLKKLLSTYYSKLSNK